MFLHDTARYCVHDTARNKWLRKALHTDEIKNMKHVNLYQKISKNRFFKHNQSCSEDWNNSLLYFPLNACHQTKFKRNSMTDFVKLLYCIFGPKNVSFLKNKQLRIHYLMHVIRYKFRKTQWLDFEQSQRFGHHTNFSEKIKTATFTYFLMPIIDYNFRNI